MQASNYGDRYYKDWTNSDGSDYDAGDVIQAGGMAAVVSHPGGIDDGDEGAIQIGGLVRVAHVALAGSPGQVIGWDEDGDPYNGTSGDGCATTKLSDADFLLGTIVAGIASDGSQTETISATTEQVLVDLNVYPAGLEFLQNMTIEQVSANKTLDAEDVGKVMLVDTDDKVITLPATSAGEEFVIMNGGADGTVGVTVSPQSDDKLMGADLGGTNDTDRINTKSTAKAGDFVRLQADGADGYYVTAERGTWEDET